MIRASLGASLSACALALLATAACSSETYDGVPLDVRYTGSGASPTVASNDETSIELTTLRYAIGVTHILECPEASARATVFPRQLAQRVGDWLWPAAWAHSPSTPTSSGTPVVVSVAPNSDVTVERALRPVRGKRFCAVRILVAPADDDAIGLADDPAMENRSLHAIGQVDGAPFDLVIARRHERTIALTEPLVVEDGAMLFVETAIEDIAEEWLTHDASMPSDEKLLRATLDATRVRVGQK